MFIITRNIPVLIIQYSNTITKIYISIAFVVCLNLYLITNTTSLIAISPRQAFSIRNPRFKNKLRTIPLFVTKHLNENMPWDADRYQREHSFVYEYGSSLIDIAKPQLGDCILDIGCGTGELTYQLYTEAIKQVSNEVIPINPINPSNDERTRILSVEQNDKSKSKTMIIGIDVDQNMIDKAKEQFSVENNIKFIHADIREMNITDFLIETQQKQFDIIFSNAVFHWIPEQDMDHVIEVISQLLQPQSGRLVLEFGGKGNIQTIITACQDVLQEMYNITDYVSPWYFPSISEFTSILEKHHIEIDSVQLYDRPTPLHDPINGMKHWIQMFGQNMIQLAISASTNERVIQNSNNDNNDNVSQVDEIDQTQQQQQQQESLFLDAVNERLKPLLYDGNQWIADYRRIRVIGHKQSI